jgi:hypothetical protein
MFDLQELLTHIETLTKEEVVELSSAFRKAAQARLNALDQICRNRDVAEAWTRVEKCKPGTILYLGGESTMRFDNWQTGDSIKVTRIDLERERLYYVGHRCNGKLVKSKQEFWLTASGVNSWELSRQKPKRAATASERTMVRRINEAFS